MIFFSSDPDFAKFYHSFSAAGLNIDLLVTESAKAQGRSLSVKPNPAHQFAIDNDIPVETFDKLDDIAIEVIKKKIGQDKLGFIFAYGKLIPNNLIYLFENGILNIHFSLLPEYPGASPIQQAILDGKPKTGYTVFEITDKLDDGPILIQEPVEIASNDNFESLRSRIIDQALETLPETINKYLTWEVKLSDMPAGNHPLTRKISKTSGELTDQDDAEIAYRKIRAFSRWPKTYIVAGNKRLIVIDAKLSGDKLEILTIQPEGKRPMSFHDFANGYRELLTKMPRFVKIN